MIEIAKIVNLPCMVHVQNVILGILFQQIILVVVIFNIAYYVMMKYVMFVKKDILYLSQILNVNLI